MAKLDWVGGGGTARQEPTPGIVSARYTLNELVHGGLINRRRAASFRSHTGLADFTWRVYWPREDRKRTTVADVMPRVQGVVVFMHGWDGTHAIWEQIPPLVCAANPNLIALAADVNGFGGSPFIHRLPDLNTCDPAANMAAVQRWIDLLGLRSGPRATRRMRTVTLVGHSMSGAALFYLDESRWRPYEVSRLAIAPALLINDALRKSFYIALGVGIWAGSTADVLAWLKRKLAFSIVGMLIGSASRAVKTDHVRVFNATPKGVLAQTFFAMGAVPHRVEPRQWSSFNVVLGHQDRLVGLKPMLNLLAELGFGSDQIRVMLGDHYLFSVSNQSRRLHARNRELVIEQILTLHDTCRRGLLGGGEAG